MDDKEITQEVSKYAFRWFVICGLIALLSIFMWEDMGCSGKTKQVVKEVDTLTPKIVKNNQAITVLNDSIPFYKEQARLAWIRKNYYKQKYISLFDSLYSVSDSICKISLQLVNQAKLKQDSAHEAENEANLSIINNQSKQIGLYKDNKLLYDLRHKKDSSEISYLINDSIPKVFKRGLNKGRKQGFIFGAIIAEAVNIGAKIKP